MRRTDRQTDVELLEAVRGGNAPAYGTLYQRHAVAARSLAQQFIQGEEEVEDTLVETFAGILDLIRAGAGPVFAFRPYLLMAVRRYAAIGAVDLTDPDAVYVDPELTGLERAVLARAFFSLPERWRMVLWHADVESARPGDLARRTCSYTGRAVRARNAARSCRTSSSTSRAACPSARPTWWTGTSPSASTAGRSSWSSRTCLRGCG